MSASSFPEARNDVAPTAGLYACVLLVSAATLLLEIALTRIFAVTQGYHFAFLAISLALLGFGASGTALAIVPNLASRDVRPLIAGAGLLFAVTSVGGLYLVKALPFDAYTLLWEPSQLAYLAVYYMALAVPFFFAGSIVGAALAKHPTRAGGLYGVNLVGAGIGCLLSVVFPLVVGTPGSVVVAAVIALSRLRRRSPAANCGVPHGLHPGGIGGGGDCGGRGAGGARTETVAVQGRQPGIAARERLEGLEPVERVLARGGDRERQHPRRARSQLCLSRRVAEAVGACGRRRQPEPNDRGDSRGRGVCRVPADLARVQADRASFGSRDRARRRARRAHRAAKRRGFGDGGHIEPAGRRGGR